MHHFIVPMVITCWICAGCGGDDRGGGTDAGGGTDSGGGGVDSGGGGVDSGGGDVDAGGGDVDAGGSGVDAGAGMGTVSCGTMTCDTATEQCCVTRDAAGVASFACIPGGDRCMGAALGCDGPEDCGMRQVCCATLAAGAARTRCVGAAMCGGMGSGEVVVCHDDSTCPAMAMCCPGMRAGFMGGYCARTCT